MKYKDLFAKFAVLGLLGIGMTCQAAWAQNEAGSNLPAHVPGRILVKFKDGVSDGQARGLLAGRGALSTNVIPQIGVHVVQLPPNANEQAEANAFKHLAEVEFAELEGIRTPQGLTPNDPNYSSQWALPKIAAPDAWTSTTGSSSVILAILDTGVNAVPDLGSKFILGWNFWDNNSNTADITGHGTLVAGAAAAVGNNRMGVASPCWGCSILPVRITDINGGAWESVTAQGLTWAADHGARVAIVAFAFTYSSTVTAAAQYFQSKGGVVIMPISNTAGYFDPTPDNPYVLTIGATDPNDLLYFWSSTGNDVDLAAPGTVYSTTSSGGYASVGGTSYSTALVGGAAGLIFSVQPCLGPSQVRSILEHSADPLGSTVPNTSYGWGRLNAFRAVTLAGSTACGGGLTATTTALTSSLNPSILGNLVKFTATVSPSAVTGAVTFFDGATSVGSGTVVAGVATLGLSSLSGGSHSIKAAYNGDSKYNTSTSAVLTQTVNTTTKTNTTTTLTSSLNPSTYGQSVTFNATVSYSSATGTVTFYDGTMSLGTFTLSSGRAALTTSSLSAGSHSIKAAYNGDSNYNTSTSAVLTQTVNTTTKTNTTTALTSSLNPSTYGQSVTFTATVSYSSATGTVTFYDGTTSLGTFALSSGRAALTTSSLSAGSHSIKATYNGDSNYNTSTSALLTQTVNGIKIATSTALVSDLNPSTNNKLVTFSATVSPSSVGGSVTFYDGTTVLGTVAVSGGPAKWSTSTLSGGAHPIKAVYSGSSTYNGSTSPVLSEVIQGGSK